MRPIKCPDCSNSATNDGYCYSHYLARNHKNETAKEVRDRLNKPIRDYEIGKLEQEWQRKSYHQKMVEVGDYIPGIDDGEAPGWYYRENREEFDNDRG